MKSGKLPLTIFFCEGSHFFLIILLDKQAYYSYQYLIYDLIIKAILNYHSSQNLMQPYVKAINT